VAAEEMVKLERGGLVISSPQALRDLVSKNVD
jgi:hypothetical protein